MSRKLFAEFIGTALLLISIVGSGIMAETLADGNIGLALLINSIATGCALYVVLTVLIPVSGAHINPVVTLFFALKGDIEPGEAVAYGVVQIIGGILGVLLCHVMFDLSLLQLATKPRTGAGLWVSEIFATFGLLMIIVGGLKARAEAVPMLVGIYITGAYWFSSSSGFANPAVTVARVFTDTFTGINPAHVAMYIIMQIIGMGVALVVLPRLYSND